MDNKNVLKVDENIIEINKKIVDDQNLMDLVKSEFCIAVATEAKAEIDKIFNKNKIEYIKAYKESSVYKSNLICSCVAETFIYAEKAAGILEMNLKNEDYTDVLNIYKKAYRKMYNNTRFLKKVSIRDILRHISPGYRGNYEAVATLYMYILLEKVDDIEECFEVIDGYIKDLLIAEKYLEVNFSKTTISQFAEEIKDVRDYLGVNKRSYTAEELIRTITGKDMERYNKSKILMPYEMTNDVHYMEKIGDISKYIGAMEGLFKYLQIESVEMFSKATFSSFEIDQIICNYFFSQKFNTFKESDRNAYLISCIYFAVIGKEYNSLKKRYVKEFNEDYLINIDNLEKKLNNSIKSMKDKEEKYIEKNNYYTRREKELLDKIAKLEKENKSLKNQIKKDEPLKQEVVKLRNFVFDSSANIDYLDDVKLDEIDIDKLNDKNVVIFGGNQTWVRNMKERLPNATFVSEESKNNNLNFLNRNNVVFINIKMGHSFYYKIKSVLEKLNLDFYYIAATGSNVDLSLIDMSKAINN